MNDFSTDLIDKINNNDKTLLKNKEIQKISQDLDIKNHSDAIYDYYKQLKHNHNIANDKQILDNGTNKIPEFSAIDVLTLGITYLIKLAIQGNKDYQHFKQNEPIIAKNCATNNIDYVSNNKKDNIKDITKGIALYHEISELREKLRQNDKDIHLSKEMRDKSALLSKMCQQNKTLNTLINSDKPSCALANGMLHVGIIASRINNGKKEFFLIDQGGRKVPGSGFPNDDEFSKSGINVAQVSSTNGMCMATAEKGLLEISNRGLNDYLDRYASIIRTTQCKNVILADNESISCSKPKMMIMSVGHADDNRSSNNSVCSNTKKIGIQML